MKHQAPVHAVAFRPDGQSVVTASSDKTARLWDAATGQPIGYPCSTIKWSGPSRSGPTARPS